MAGRLTLGWCRFSLPPLLSKSLSRPHLRRPVEALGRQEGRVTARFSLWGLAVSTPADRPSRMRFAGAGIELAVAVLVLALIGSFVDRYTGTARPWGLLVGGALGFTVGMGKLFRLARKYNR